MSKKNDKLGKKTRSRKKEKEEREQERRMEKIRQFWIMRTRKNKNEVQLQCTSNYGKFAKIFKASFFPVSKLIGAKRKTWLKNGVFSL